MTLQLFIFVYWTFLIILMLALLLQASRVSSAKKAIYIIIALSIFPLHFFTEGGPHIVWLRKNYEAGNIIDVQEISFQSQNALAILSTLKFGATRESSGKEKARLEIFDLNSGKAMTKRWVSRTGETIPSLASVLKADEKLITSSAKEELKSEGYELHTVYDSNPNIFAFYHPEYPFSNLKDPHQFISAKLLGISDKKAFLIHQNSFNQNEKASISAFDLMTQQVVWTWPNQAESQAQENERVLEWDKDETEISYRFLKQFQKIALFSHKRILFLNIQNGKLEKEYDQENLNSYSSPTL